MYRPRSFAIDNAAAIRGLMTENGFATLLTPHAGGIEITHIPLLLDVDKSRYGVLSGHVARANPHWRHWSDDAPESVAIFHGPHGYISPGWYADTRAVPTWNYAVVHAIGRPRLLEDRERLKALVMRLASVYEAPLGRPWNAEAAAGVIERELDGIVGFTMPIDRLEGKFKLSQNRSAADRDGVIAALEALGSPQAALAASMRHPPPKQ